MRKRYSPRAVERALKLQEGSVLAVEVEHLRAENARLRVVSEATERMVRDVLEQNQLLRERVTTGGPPAPFTENWERGDSSRPPTAPPEELVVALPVSDEEVEIIARYGDCESCRLPHPPWISCEQERQAIDMGERPPDPM